MNHPIAILGVAAQTLGEAAARRRFWFRQTGLNSSAICIPRAPPTLIRRLSDTPAQRRGLPCKKALSRQEAQLDQASDALGRSDRRQAQVMAEQFPIRLAQIQETHPNQVTAITRRLIAAYHPPQAANSDPRPR